MSQVSSASSTLLDLLERGPADKIAIVLPERNIRITYAELLRQVQAVAEQLAAAGVSRGDRVGIALPNGLPMIVSFLAASMAGTAAPLNPAYKEDEFRFYLEDTDARVLILPPDGADEARRAAGDCAPILTVDMDAAGAVHLAAMAAEGAALRHDARASEPAPTTSRWSCTPAAAPAGPSACRSRTRTCRSRPATSRAATRSTADDVSLCVMPLFHVHGLVASTLATLSTGGTVVVPGKFSPLSFWRVASDHGVTWYSAVPTIHQLLLARAATRHRASRRAPRRCASSDRAARRCRRR